MPKAEMKNYKYAVKTRKSPDEPWTWSGDMDLFGATKAARAVVKTREEAYKDAAECEESGYETRIVRITSKSQPAIDKELADMCDKVWTSFDNLVALLQDNTDIAIADVQKILEATAILAVVEDQIRRGKI